MSRKKKLAMNGLMALVKQLVTLICGFILPRYILEGYGSNVNGLISSITQFLGFITFLEMGIGPVIQSNLYKPLAEKDNYEISKIYLSGKKFFRNIAYIFVAYIVVLIFIFPNITDVKFGWLYTGSLIVIISISSFAQYYFGMIYQLLLNADQKAYIQFFLQTITLILNTLFSVVLIKSGTGIHVVKLVTAALFLIRPICMMLYVNKHYDIDGGIELQGEPIKQKWNGFAQHLASVVVQNTDVTVLTIFSSLSNVSIYSVYYLVVKGVSDIVLTVVTGLEALWGNMLANEEWDGLNKSFDFVEWAMHTGVTFLFSITAVLIVPFVRVYTKGITDVDYVVPMFAVTLVIAYGCLCLRVPYFRIIKAAGHYKETQNGSFIQMIINIVLSVLLVSKYGLIGVGLGTLIAMLYHTIYFAWYLRKNILNRPFRVFISYLLKDCLLAGLIYVLTYNVQLAELTYWAWIVMALKVVLVAMIPAIVMNFVRIRKALNLLKKR